MIKSLLAKSVSKLYEILHRLRADAQRQQFSVNPESDVHSSFRLGTHNKIGIDPSAKIQIAENVTINEYNLLTVKPRASFSVGRGTYITRSTITCLERIEIGENCLFGEGSKIFDHNHQHTSEPFSVSKTEFNTAPVKIGNNVWTGANCVILKGVTIGDNVILGAGCVVHRDVSANSVVVANQNQSIKNI